MAGKAKTQKSDTERLKKHADMEANCAGSVSWKEKERTLDEYIEKTGNLPCSQIAGVEFVGAVSGIWSERPRSNLVKHLMGRSGKTKEEIAACLGVSTRYFNNKLHRDCFSLDEIIAVAYVCGYLMMFRGNNPKAQEQDSFQIDVQEYFAARDRETLLRLYQHDEWIREKKKAEYDDLRVRLEQMKAAYSFED